MLSSSSFLSSPIDKWRRGRKPERIAASRNSDCFDSIGGGVRTPESNFLGTVVEQNRIKKRPISKKDEAGGARDRGPGPPGDGRRRAAGPLRQGAAGQAAGQDQGAAEDAQPRLGRGVRLPGRGPQGPAPRLRAPRGPLLLRRRPRPGQGAPHRRARRRQQHARDAVVPAAAQEQEGQAQGLR